MKYYHQEPNMQTQVIILKELLTAITPYTLGFTNQVKWLYDTVTFRV